MSRKKTLEDLFETKHKDIEAEHEEELDEAEDETADEEPIEEAEDCEDDDKLEEPDESNEEDLEESECGDEDDEESDDEDDSDDEDEKAMKEGLEVEQIDESVFKAKLSQDLGSLLEGEELDAEFKTKAAAVFEAAVERRVKAEVRRLNEFAPKFFDAQVTKACKVLHEKNSAYMNFVAKEWLKENEVPLASKAKVEMADSLLEGLRDLFHAHNVEMPKGGRDVLAEQEQVIGDLKSQLADAHCERIEIISHLKESAKQLAIVRAVDGMTPTEAEKIRSLAESVEYISPSKFDAKIKALKENFKAPKSTKRQKDSQLLSEGDSGIEETKTIKESDPMMAAILNSLDLHKPQR